MNNPIILTDPTGLIGDYYTRSGTYIGTDKHPNDGKVYFGDIGSKEGDITYVTNAVETTPLEVLHVQNWYARSSPGRTPNFLDSFPDDPFGEAASGFGKGLGNFAVDTANTATSLALNNGRTFPILDNPLAIERFSLDTPIQRNFGIGTYGALTIAGGVAAAPFRAGSALSVVPESPQLSRGAQMITGLVGQPGQAAGSLNKAGDLVITGERFKFRVDFRNPGNDAPHMHLEQFTNGKWRDAVRGTHRIYPR